MRRNQKVGVKISNKLKSFTIIYVTRAKNREATSPCTGANTPPSRYKAEPLCKGRDRPNVNGVNWAASVEKIPSSTQKAKIAFEDPPALNDSDDLKFRRINQAF
jgi:hypothetical protein